MVGGQALRRKLVIPVADGTRLLLAILALLAAQQALTSTEYHVEHAEASSRIPGRQGKQAGFPTAGKQISDPSGGTNPAASCSAPPPRRTTTAAATQQLPEDHSGPLPLLHRPAAITQVTSTGLPIR